MKKYKLLKDLPFAKAGETFKEMLDGDEKVLAPEEWVNFRHEIFVEELDNFDEWFEKVETRWIKYWYITDRGNITTVSVRDSEGNTFGLDMHKEIGNYFETEEEAKKHLERLKARAVLLGDVKPNSDDRPEFEVRLDRLRRTLRWVRSDWDISSEIRFSTKEDAQASIKNHEKEWKIYLGVE